jgi:hypothetical protein
LECCRTVIRKATISGRWRTRTEHAIPYPASASRHVAHAFSQQPSDFARARSCDANFYYRDIRNIIITPPAMAAASERQKAVIVGAGPVGSLAALYAAARGDDVELYELRGGRSHDQVTSLSVSVALFHAPSMSRDHAFAWEIAVPLVPGFPGRCISPSIMSALCPMPMLLRFDIVMASITNIS